MSELVVRNLSVRYGDVDALRDVNLEVASGEIVAVIGPSGCGKSSLLRAIAGLEPLASGSIALEGKDLAGVATHERDLGLMFQDHALFPHLNVADNVAFGLRMQKQKQKRAKRRARVAELLELVGLEELAGRSIDALSGGEAQRVALARALAPRPGLLMLDEPLGSLDQLLRQQLVAELWSMFAELEVTALHVTHDQGEAFALADRVVVLRDGEIQQVGRPVDVWRDPSSAFVARFLGHPNVWGGGSSPSDSSESDSGRSDESNSSDSLSDDNGSGDGSAILVPISAISARRDDRERDSDLSAADLERSVIVQQVQFIEGRFRVTARSEGSTLCQMNVGPVPVVLDMIDEPEVGSRLLIKVDHRQVVAF